jgi:hypothetical protein
MSATPKKPQNYLNNKDILKEIHLSKNTYCSYLSPDDHKYDFILDAPEHTLEENLQKLIDPAILQQAKETRATRLSIETDQDVKASDILDTDVVFRVMTWDHVPLSPKQPRKAAKKKTAKDFFEFEDDEEDLFEELEDPTTVDNVYDMIHMKVNFPPFQHFKITADGKSQCVGKSHWTGTLANGHFSKDHGQITNKLAKMYMMMCEKYAMKFNWRNYTYNDEMRSSAILQLTYVGLRFNESKSNNPFAYYTAAITNSFCRVLNTEKRNQNIRDDILVMNELNPSWTRMSISNNTENFYD